MNNRHHLVLGELRDYLSGETLPDTHDERYRQKLARLLVEQKGYAKQEIEPRRPLVLVAGEERRSITVDLVVRLSGKACMIVQYGPGSLVSRHRPALSVSRLVESYQVPVVVVSNGEDADVLLGDTGRKIGQRLTGIPDRGVLAALVAERGFAPIPTERIATESRIALAFELECGCPGEEDSCEV